MEGVSERFFQIENEWNVIHLPEKPNGFGILIIGDRTHFVENGSSYWLEHYGRRQLINTLKSCGYTLFHSNLYGRHWGSPHAVLLAKQLYHLVMKQEILNKKIHILSEGIGALVALQLMEEMPNSIRSSVMINPCLDIKAQIAEEKKNKFFYKQMIKELSKAYQLEEKAVTHYPFVRIQDFVSKIPVGIWQKMNGGSYSYKIHGKKYEEWRKQLKAPIQFTFYFQENINRIHDMIRSFYKEHERIL